MERIASFKAISESQFVKDYINTFPNKSETEAIMAYQSLALPTRATRGSAGYDFRSTVSFVLSPGKSIKIPTGIRAEMREDYCLMIFPRSGLGFKYRLQLDNSVGIIDSDYFYSDNEGHIFIKITNDSTEGKAVTINSGDAFAQGIFVPFGITTDDSVNATRNGGFGSTSK